MSHPQLSRASSLILAACVTIAGCTTAPIVRLDVSDSSTAGANMPEALRYLDSARAQYRNAVATQINNERTLSNSLIGTGALVAALALGKAHRDAIVGTSFLGGTAYAIGSANHLRPRVMIYQAGVEALNCAERAVAPFVIEKTDLEKLIGSLEKLDKARLTLTMRVAEAQALRKNQAPTSSAAIAFDAMIPLVEQAQQASNTTLLSGREFVSAARIGARQLVAAVNGIDAAVVRSVISSTPDLSNVPKVISVLAGMIGSFAPGAGVEALIAQRLSGLASAKSATGGTDAMEQANDAVLSAVRDLAASNVEVMGQMAGRTTPWPVDAFKDCGVEQVVAPLSASPTSLRITPNTLSPKTVDIAGGITRYFVEIDGSVEGLTVKQPGRYDTSFQILIDHAKLKSTVETTLRISDNSPTPRKLTIPLLVDATPPKPDGKEETNPGADPKKDQSANKPTDPPKKATESSDAAALAKVSTFKVNGKEFGVVGKPKMVGNAYDVVVKCPSNTALKRSEIASALLAEAGITSNPPPTINLKTMPASCISG
jgi:hypothetical protein